MSRVSMLIPFDSLIDTDYGMIKAIDSIYKDSEIFDKSIYDFTDNQIVYLLLNRIRENPLCLICRENEDMFYEDMMKNHYDIILSKSRNTDIVNMLIGASNMQFVSIYIYCKNKLEEQIIRKKLSHIVSNLNIIVSDSIEDLDFCRFQALFVPKISQIQKLKDIVPKTIKFYIHKAVYNLQRTDEGYIVPPEAIEGIELARVSIATPYTMDKSYFIDMEEK